MNALKAREFFSAYYEGTLEPGFKESLESKLASDAQLQAEYRAFCRAISQIEGLRSEAIEIPHDLHDTISARLDRHLWEKERAKPAFFSGWLRSVFVGATATAALAFAVLSFNQRSNANMSGGFSVNDLRPQISASGADVTMSLPKIGNQTLEVRDADTGNLIQSVLLENQEIQSPLENKRKDSVLLAIKVKSSSANVRLALPGSEAIAEANGKGKIEALAKAMAGFYGVPVQITGSASSDSITWKLKAGQPKFATESEFTPNQISVELRRGILVLIAR